MASVVLWYSGYKCLFSDWNKWMYTTINNINTWKSRSPTACSLSSRCVYRLVHYSHLLITLVFGLDCGTHCLGLVAREWKWHPSQFLPIVISCRRALQLFPIIAWHCCTLIATAKLSDLPCQGKTAKVSTYNPPVITVKWLWLSCVERWSGLQCSPLCDSAASSV